MSKGFFKVNILKVSTYTLFGFLTIFFLPDARVSFKSLSIPKENEEKCVD